MHRTRRLQWSKVATGRLEGELSALGTRSHGVVKRIEAEHPALLLTPFRKLTQLRSAEEENAFICSTLFWTSLLQPKQLHSIPFFSPLSSCSPL